MKQLFYTEYESLTSWLKEAVALGWRENIEISRLEAVETQDADQLFHQQKYRPLIVSFFGGTGVGKSSLLNRLAGSDLAKAGIERPTSKEVSIYLHKDFALANLPEDLPVAKTQVFYHANPEYKLLTFIDMPDVNSTSESNRDLVEKWLPYIDYLVYVVTPERYLDAAAWQILNARKDRHNLIFIMNYWDQAEEEQLTNFKAHLVKHGIKEPIILRTSCNLPYIDDDFSKLAQILNQAVEKYGLDLLQSLGIKAKLKQLEELKTSYLKDLDKRNWEQAKRHWDNLINQNLNTLNTNLRLNKDLLVEQNLTQLKSEKSGLLSWLKTEKVKPKLDIDKFIQKLWQDRNREQILKLNLQLQNMLQQGNLAFKSFTLDFRQMTQSTSDAARQTLERELKLSLARPGNVFTRFFYKIFGILSWFLPLAAAIWALYHLVETFYLAEQDQGSYLHINFMGHSLMLIFVSWLVPKILHIKLAPKLKATINKGLSKGIEAVDVQLQDVYQTIWTAKTVERTRLANNLAKNHAD